jgi:signal transduction histidine kinase/ActR/RegA family two-component response regulator
MTDGAAEDGTEAALRAEIERLSRERLDLLREVDRVVSLGDFVLRCSTIADPLDVVGRAVGLLKDLLGVPLVRAVGLVDDSIDPSAFAAAPSKRTLVLLPPPLATWLAEAPTAALVHAGEPSDAPDVIPLLRGVFPERNTTWEHASVTVLPLRPHPGRPVGAIIAVGEAGAGPTDADATLLVLATNHIGRALQNALLVSDLRSRSEELAESTRRYRENLEDLQRTQRELLQARKLEAIGRLAGGIAHDFNNLLTVIRNHAEFLKEGKERDQEDLGDIAAIAEAADRATRITRQLLAFGRRNDARPELLDLNRMTTEFTKLISRLVGEHVTIELRLEPSLRPVRADRAQLEQVLLNLLTNARDAMPDGGVIVVRTRPTTEAELAAVGLPANPARFLALVVSDSGRGMDDATRAHLFEPFFTTKEPGQGTGLGLATVYGIVDGHGGKIQVTSEPERGTSFTIFLPTSRSSSVEVEAVRGPTADRAAGLGATILLVEDDPALRSVAFRTLSSRGYRVLQARDGAEGMEIAKKHTDTIDVVVTDVVMPRLSGPKLVAQLRALRPTLKVVYVSGYTFDMLDPRTLEDGTFLTKPFTAADLAAAVKEAVAQAKGV